METALLLGLHPLKHALRFKAHIVWAKTADKQKLMELAKTYAPDVAETIDTITEEIPAKVFLELSSQLHTSAKECEVIAEAKKPKESLLSPIHDVAEFFVRFLKGKQKTPFIFLENPTHLGNIGACIRVAAAAGAAGVLVSGQTDPWHSLALKGSQGLHFALPVVHIYELPENLPLPLYAFSDEGEMWQPQDAQLPAVFAFGSERRGLSQKTKERADKVLALPMQPGVSSLNLATAVSAALYALHYSRNN